MLPNRLLKDFSNRELPMNEVKTPQQVKRSFDRRDTNITAPLLQFILPKTSFGLEPTIAATHSIHLYYETPLLFYFFRTYTVYYVYCARHS